MGFLSGIFKKEVNREATSLDIFFIVTGLYHGFYEKYGYDQQVEPAAMVEFYIDSLKKANLTLNSLPNREILGVSEFMSNVAMDCGDFPSLLKEFKKIQVDLSSDEWKSALKKLLNEMNSKGLNSELYFD
jgi:hypothetical protein